MQHLWVHQVDGSRLTQGWCTHIALLGYVMAGAQVMMTVPNFYKLETSRYDLSNYNSFIDEPLDIRKGDLYIPERPGLGVNLDPEALKKYAIEGFDG